MRPCGVFVGMRGDAGSASCNRSPVTAVPAADGAVIWRGRDEVDRRFFSGNVRRRTDALWRAWPHRTNRRFSNAGTAGLLTAATLLSRCATHDARYAYPDAGYETNTRYGERDVRYYGTDSRYQYPDARYEGRANDSAIRYNGRIPRDVYIDKMGRRWESDANRVGTRDAYLNDLRGPLVAS